MQTILDTPIDTLDQSEMNFVAEVREHGWFRTSVLQDDTGPGFAYSTGFWLSTTQPELIVFGMNAEIAHDVFWDLFRKGKANVGLPVGKRTADAFANLPAYTFPVAKKFYANYLGWSRWFYIGDEFPCLQLVWPDSEGVFPWEEGFDLKFQDIQPDLTELGWKATISD